MNKPTFILLGVVLGFIGGLFLGKTINLDPSLPGPVASSPTKPGAASLKGSVEAAPDAVSPGTSSRNPEPLSAAQLLGELAGLERSGAFMFGGFTELAALEQRLKASDIPTIARSLASSADVSTTNTMSRQVALSLVLSALARTDPGAAWTTASSIQNPSEQQSARFAVASVVGRNNPEQILAWADSEKNPQTQIQLRATAISSLARTDPQRALEITLSKPTASAGTFDNSIANIFNQWAVNDLEAAKAAVARLDADQARQAIGAIAAAMARTDIEAAWRYAQEVSPSGSSSRDREFGYTVDARQQVISTWALTDPRAALEAAASIEDRQSRSSATSTAISTWANSDFPAALDYVANTADAETRATALMNLVHNPKGDPAKLFQAVIDHHPPGYMFQHTLQNIVSKLPEADLKTAAVSIQSLPPGETLTSSVSSLASSWIEKSSNPGDVLKWLQGMPEGAARSSGIGSAFSALAERDPAAATRALGALTMEQSSAQNSIATGWAKKDPKAALQWAGTLANPGDRESALQRVISSWANQAPQAAAAALTSIPEGSARSNATASLVSSWAHRDLESAAAWVDNLAAGPSKNSALGQITDQMVRADPESAIKWAGNISEPKLRTRKTEQAAREWLRSDPATAREWISKNLPPEIKTKLLK